MRWIPIVVLAGCHHAAPNTAGPENAAVTPGVAGYVLVSQGAWLRSAPRADAIGARGEALTGAATDEPNLEQVWVARAIADRGDWVELENLPGDDAAAHCYPSIGGLDAFRLRLHVAAADLVPVTTRAISMRYDDGSGLELSAGVAVAPIDDAFRIGVDWTHPVVGLDRDAVGRSYASPTEHLDLHEDPEAVEAFPPGAFVVDGTEVTLPDSMMQTARVEDGPDPDHQLVTVTMACSAYHGLVEKMEGGYGYGPGGYGYGTIGSGITDLPEIRAGAKLTWPDGSPAGETVRQFQVYWGGDAKGCFRVPLRATVDHDWTGKEEWFLQLCAADADWIAGYGG